MCLRFQQHQQQRYLRQTRSHANDRSYEGGSQKGFLRSGEPHDEVTGLRSRFHEHA